MGGLEELAGRCEAADGPDRALDVAIAVAVDWRWPDWEDGESTARGQAEKHGLDWLIGRSIDGMVSMWRHIPAYTASLDSAMALVPEGWAIDRIAMWPTGGPISCYANLRGIIEPTGFYRSGEILKVGARGCSIPLALTSAALKARARANGAS